MSSATAAGAFKNAVYAKALTVYAAENVQVCFGHPGQIQQDDIVAITDLRVTQDPATLSPLRSREEELRLGVTISIYRAGGPEQEKVASDRAYELLGMLEQVIRESDPRLGDVVRDCFLESHDSEGSTVPEIMSAGRLIEVAAVFLAHNRVTT